MVFLFFDRTVRLEVLLKGFFEPLDLFLILSIYGAFVDSVSCCHFVEILLMVMSCFGDAMMVQIMIHELKQLLELSFQQPFGLLVGTSQLIGLGL